MEKLFSSIFAFQCPRAYPILNALNAFLEFEMLDYITLDKSVAGMVGFGDGKMGQNFCELLGAEAFLLAEADTEFFNYYFHLNAEKTSSGNGGCLEVFETESYLSYVKNLLLSVKRTRDGTNGFILDHSFIKSGAGRGFILYHSDLPVLQKNHPPDWKLISNPNPSLLHFLSGTRPLPQ